MVSFVVNTRSAFVLPSYTSAIPLLRIPSKTQSPLSPCVLNGLPPLDLSCISFSTSPRLFSMLCSLFFQNTRGGVPPPFPDSRIKMTLKSHSSDLPHERCQYRTATGRQCCSVAVDPDSSFCARHAASESSDSEDFSLALTQKACRFQNARASTIRSAFSIRSSLKDASRRAAPAPLHT